MKALLLSLVLLVVAGAALGVYFFYKEFWEKGEIQKEILSELREEVFVIPEPVDEGALIFEAVEPQLREGLLEEARVQLEAVIRLYPDSARTPEAKRIIGGLNLDRLFSRDPHESKRTVLVRSGDSLLKIARQEDCTYHFLLKANGLTHPQNLHPGEELVVADLDFELEVDLEKGRVTLLRAGAFFCDYPILGSKIPGRVRLPFRSKVVDKIAFVEGERILLSDERYPSASLRIRIGEQGMDLRPLPEAEQEVFGGVFLSAADLDELNALLRLGTPAMVY
ncbi:MAG: LysM domain-containing protein [Verrucomicrobiota bacterium]